MTDADAAGTPSAGSADAGGPVAARGGGRTAMLALLVVVVAGVVRFWDLDAVGISQWDAGSYVAGPLGLGPYGKQEILLFYAPPLLPWLHGRIMDLSGGFDDRWLIGFHALLGTLTVLATGRVGTRLVGRAAGWLGAAVLAVMAWHVTYSRQPLTESLYTLLFVLAIGAGFDAWRRRRASRWILFGALSGTACLVKYHGFFPFLVLGALVVAATIPRLLRPDGALGTPRADAPPTLASGARGLLLAAGVAALPVAALVLHIRDAVGLEVFRENRTQWLPEPGLYLVPQTLRYLWACLDAWTSLLPIVLGAVGAVALALRRSPGGFVVLAWLALFVATLPLYKNYPRLPVPMLPALALAAGVGLELGVRDRRESVWPPAWSTGFLAAVTLLVGGLHLAVTGTLTVSDRGYAELAAFLRDPPAQAVPATPHADRRDGPDILVTQHAVIPYLGPDAHPFLMYDETGAREALERGDFRFLVFDLRSIHAPAFTAFRDAHRDRLESVARIENPLPGPFLVNAAGFEALADLEDPSTSAERRDELATIRVWRRR